MLHHPLPRRTALKAAAVSIALPWLEAMGAPAKPAKPAGRARRMILGNFPLGWNAESFFPQTTGRGYTMPEVLKAAEAHRDDFTILQGLTHGLGGHQNEVSIFSGWDAHGGKKLFSIDQLAAEAIGRETRFPSLQFGRSPGIVSWNRAGVPLPYVTDPEVIFQNLFGAADTRREREQFARQESILDGVLDQAKQMQKRLGVADQKKLDEYFYSVREVELEIARQRQWLDKPKPQARKPYTARPDIKKFYERTRVMYDLMALALETDSTRVMTFACFEQNQVDLPSVGDAYHNLSHHGQDATKLQQLRAIESQNMGELARFLGKLKNMQVEGRRLLDDTIVLATSNLGNASNHSGGNLPVLLAGGGFKSHGQHLKLTPVDSTPMCNLFVTLLQTLGLEVDQWGPSSGSLSSVLS